MKNNKHIATALNCFLFITCIVLFTCCNKSDELNTNQLSDSELTLKAFGPCPVARGAELRIIGTNLDRVESVTIPGASPITNMNRISKTEIRITVPQAAETGFISLKAGDKIITSITPIFYSEPISIDRFTPATVKPGAATLRIEGEYLNLIRGVIFVNADLETNHVLQADFISQSREAIELPVPLTAQTGKIIVSDGADLVEEGETPGIPILVYSENDLIVTLPAFTAISPKPVKKGKELTITGTNLDLVEFLKFGNSDIEVTKFIGTASSITVLVPEETQIDATTGKGELKLVAFSGVEVTYDDLRLVAPVITGISPNPSKNNGLLTIEGTNLDLVTTVVFAENVEGEIDDESRTDVLIKVKVPATAIAGKIVLNTHSGQTAEMDYTLVQPVISSIAPLNLTAGDDLTITGSDLDLAVEVIFKSGEGTVSANLTTAPNSASFTVRTPFTATDGTVVLKTANGTLIESTQSLTIAEATLPVVTDMPLAVLPGGLLTMRGVNLETVTKIVFVYSSEEITATRFLPDASGQALQVYVPNKTGDVTIRLYAGDDFVETSVLKIMTADPVTDRSLLIFDFDNEPKVGSVWGAGAIVSGDDGVDGDFFEITPATGAGGTWVWLFASNAPDFQAALPQVTAEDHVLKFDVRIRNDITVENEYCNLQFRMGPHGDITIDASLRNGNVFSTSGNWTTITIPLTELGITGTTANTGDWGFIINQGNPIASFAGLCIDNIRYERISQ